jgi:hypothetical protein
MFICDTHIIVIMGVSVALKKESTCVDFVSRTAGNNSTVTEEPIVLPDLPIRSDD